jgi:hypothetical protein
MAKKDSLTEELKKHFGFDTFKGNQKAIIENVLSGMIICGLCQPEGEIFMLSATFIIDGGNCNCNFSSYCIDEEPGGCHA